MLKTNEKGMVRNLRFFKKQAAQHLLTPKSKFDFIKSPQVAESNSRKALRVKSITHSQYN